MPLVTQLNLNHDTSLLVWHITENAAFLNSLLQDKLSDPKSIRVKDNLHWLASRVCIASFFSSKHIQVKKDIYNKPSLIVAGEPFNISITHSFKYAAVLISRSSHVALDMEKIDPRIERVKFKFCNTEELVFAKDDMQILTTIWSAKETLYKYYGKKEVDFKTQLQINPFVQNEKFLKGKVSKSDFTMDLELNVLYYDDYIITYIVN